ncbi:MAG: mono/diheme cytochrome c family protein [Bradymonadia bacterium]|jgi:mono/diheme cytochrome c family protein
MRLALYRCSTRHTIAALTIAFSALLPACGDDGAHDEVDTGPPPVCAAGLDLNGDGVCDRDLADWSRDATLEGGLPRTDIYQLGDALGPVVSVGIGHSFVWPVDVSGVLLPWRPFETLFDENATDASTVQLQGLSRRALGFGTMPEMYDWLGLTPAIVDGPMFDGPTFDGVAWPAYVEDGTPLGAGLVETPQGEALTFSCATCHTANVFGQTVVGMTNRAARANEFFHVAQEFFPLLSDDVFVTATGATDDELALFARTRERLGAIGGVTPQVLGLDTALAQVSLSLARREADAQATRSEDLQNRPRDNRLNDFVSDSKPAVWWTLKYKTRWLSDGSIVSGNPIFTNFLWNELGRGTDMPELEEWLRSNMQVVDELTVAAFATPAPRWEDFFGADTIDIPAAQRGEQLFNDTCSTCHGTYAKGWSAENAVTLTDAQLIATTEVRYHEQTPVFDVGTDPQRAQSMDTFAERLNALEISQWMGTVVEVQNGYVPPPLDAIWIRYPYLHNQSVPTLCEMLLPSELRTPSFYMGPAADVATDFDADCIGYPTGGDIPASWRENDDAFFDTAGEGLSNAGHDEWLRNDDGSPAFDQEQRLDLLEYLKTL